MQDCEIVTTEFAAGHWAPVLSRILVPTDFSWRSDVTVDCAIELTRKMHAQLTILHVRPEPSALDYTLGGVSEGDWDQMKEGAERFLRDVVAHAKRRVVEVSSRLSFGLDIQHEILSMAKQIPADLLVLSTHGYTGGSICCWQRRGENRRTRALSDSCRALTQFDQPLGDGTFGQSRERNFLKKQELPYFGFGEAGPGIVRPICSIMKEAQQRAD